MPNATVRAAPNLWERLRGEQPALRGRVTWKLVAYEATLAEQLEAQTGKATDDHPDGDNNQLDGRLSDGPGNADSDSSKT
jgi:hypothetical protein